MKCFCGEDFNNCSHDDSDLFDKIGKQKSYIDNLEDNLAFSYDKEHVMRNRRKYFGEDAEQYVSYCDLRSIIKALKEEKAKLTSACFKFQGMLAEKDAIIRELDPTITGWDVENQRILRETK